MKKGFNRKKLNPENYVYTLFRIVSIVKIFNEKTKQTLTKDFIESSINRFKKFNEDTSKFKISSHLLIHLKIIPESIVNRIAKNLVFLVPDRNKFYLIFSLLFLLNFLFLALQFDIKNLNIFQKNSTFITIILLFLFVFHEFGHATSAVKFNSKPKEIGFGFYLLTPAMYCNLSDVWKLSKEKRIIINLSGIYFQLIASLFFIITYYITSNVLFLNLTMINFIMILINLNPLLKYDGYWVLLDSIDTYNLRKASFTSLKEMFTEKFKNIPKKVYFLSLYAIISILFIAYFILFFVFPNFNKILNFPKNLIVSLYKSIQNLDATIVYGVIKFNILSIIFYYIIFTIIYSKFIKPKKVL